MELFRNPLTAGFLIGGPILAGLYQHVYKPFLNSIDGYGTTADIRENKFRYINQVDPKTNKTNRYLIDRGGKVIGVAIDM